MSVRSQLLKARPDWRTAAMLLVLGMLIATGQSPLSLPLVSLVALAVLIRYFVRSANALSAAWVGWLGATGYFAGTDFWIIEPFFVDPVRHGWMAPFALVFVALGLALFWAAAFGAAYLMARTRPGRVIALIASLGIAELGRSYLLTGFPWGLLAYIWVETPVYQLSAYIGPHGLGALTLAVTGLPVFWRGRGDWVAGVLFGAVMLAAACGGGYYRLSLPVDQPQNPLQVRIVQPNAPQHLKWKPQMAEVYYERLLSISADPSDKPLDLIIWPETAVTLWLDENPREQQRIGALAGEEGKVVLGLRRLDGLRVYNSMAVLNSDGQAEHIYDKGHLVPFGEYLPFDDFLSRLGFRGLAASEGGGFSAGDNRELIDFGDQNRVLPLICYEAIFPQILTNAPTRPDWILQITNDAWFGNLAGPQQHLAQAQARAVEQGLPLVRVANTGISAVIDANGRLLQKLPLGVAGRLDFTVPGALEPTIYSKTGDWLAGFVLLGLLLGFVARRARK